MSKISQESSNTLLTMLFSTMLKKIKAKQNENLKLKTEEDHEKKGEEKINSHQARLENEKHLIRLYEGNYASIFDVIKKEYNGGEEIKNLETQTNYKKITKNLVFLSQNQKDMVLHSLTNYVNQSCMKEFFNKYSQYN